MDWKDLQSSTRALTDFAAQKINIVSDLATLHLRLKTMEFRLRSLYEELGKTTYEHFTADEGDVNDLTKYIEKIAIVRREITALRKTIRKMQETQQK